MNLITFIFGIIILIFAILQIVLFFKLWRMTNDVHLIKENKQISSNDQEEILWLLRKYILLGDTNKAQEIIVSIFLSNIRKDIATNGITNSHKQKHSRTHSKNTLRDRCYQVDTLTSLKQCTDKAPKTIYRNSATLFLISNSRQIRL